MKKNIDVTIDVVNGFEFMDAVEKGAFPFSMSLMGVRVKLDVSDMEDEVEDKVVVTDNNPKSWSEEDIQFLKENYPKMDNATIAIKVGRSVKSVKNKANSMGLYKANRQPKPKDDKPVHKPVHPLGDFEPIPINEVHKMLKRLKK